MALCNTKSQQNATAILPQLQVVIAVFCGNYGQGWRVSERGPLGGVLVCESPKIPRTCVQSEN